MTPPPRPYRFVYRAFDRFEFDPAKSQAVLDERGFDLGYVTHIFPGYVLERQDTRSYHEPRYQIIGELLGNVFVVIYTPRGRVCRLITAWQAQDNELEAWYDYFRR